jgi:hypothetical protein
MESGEEVQRQVGDYFAARHRPREYRSRTLDKHQHDRTPEGHRSPHRGGDSAATRLARSNGLRPIAFEGAFIALLASIVISFGVLARTERQRVDLAALCGRRRPGQCAGRHPARAARQDPDEAGHPPRPPRRRPMGSGNRYRERILVEAIVGVILLVVGLLLSRLA